MTEATARPTLLWVEHIMPQNWHEAWPLNGKLATRGDYAEPGYQERESALQTLGNLTITTDQLNRSMGAAEFYHKAGKLVEHSTLTLNRRIAKYKAWDESAIRDRGERLAAVAIELWPSADKV